MPVITGTFKSNPSAAMRRLIRLHPIKYKMARNCGNLLRKLRTFTGNSFWRKYDYKKRINLQI